MTLSAVGPLCKEQWEQSSTYICHSVPGNGWTKTGRRIFTKKKMHPCMVHHHIHIRFLLIRKESSSPYLKCCFAKSLTWNEFSHELIEKICDKKDIHSCADIMFLNRQEKEHTWWYTCLQFQNGCLIIHQQGFKDLTLDILFLLI